MSRLSFRDRLRMAEKSLSDIFIQLISDITPLLHSIEQVFPEFTRHDPSHTERIEQIVEDIVAPDAADAITAEDIFILLCSFWIHDAGMGHDADLEGAQKDTARYREERARSERLGQTE